MVISMSVFLAIFLGIVQGITEFLPVSSSGHLSIFQNLFGLSSVDDTHLLFDVMLHVGTFLSICFSFRRELKRIFTDALALARGETDRKSPPSPSIRMGLLIVVASLPLIIAVPFYSMLKQLFSFTGFIGAMLLITGALLFVSVKFMKSGTKTEKTLTAVDALLIGLSQAVALIPGLSRSGTTITVALARGAERDFAVRFSLLLSLPAVFGSMIITLINAIKSGIDWSILPFALLGLAISAVIGVFAIAITRALMKENKWIYCSYYCFGAGLLAIILSLILK